MGNLRKRQEEGGEGGILGRKKRGRRHMGMNKFILMKPD